MVGETFNEILSDASFLSSFLSLDIKLHGSLCLTLDPSIDSMKLGERFHPEYWVCHSGNIISVILIVLTPVSSIKLSSPKELTRMGNLLQKEFRIVLRSLRNNYRCSPRLAQSHDRRSVS